jgi:hyaluronan synthase
MDRFVLIAFLLPLVMMAMNFLIAIIIRYYFPAVKIKKDYISSPPSVSVLLPCFNEGRHVYETVRSIFASHYPSQLLEVVAVDDCSTDDSMHWLNKAKDEFPQLIVDQNVVNSGKHHTLSNALQLSSGQIIICIDSDCIFHKDAITELVVCFSEKDIGAVGGRVGIANPNENFITQCQTFIYYYAFHLFKMPQNLTRTIFCISGCLFAIKRELFLEIEKDVTSRHWFGINVKDGEDRFMTHFLVLKGYKTYINIDAECWTHVPSTYRQLFMQQLRWRRSGMRDFFWTLVRPIEHIKILNPFALFNLLLPGLMAVAWPFLIMYMILSSQPIWMQPTLLLYLAAYFIGGFIYTKVVNKINPEQHITNLFILPICGLWMLIDGLFITTLALCTFDSGDWGTRAKTKTTKD